jgi:hypothetical protein
LKETWEKLQHTEPRRKEKAGEIIPPRGPSAGSLPDTESSAAFADKRIGAPGPLVLSGHHLVGKGIAGPLRFPE